MNKIVIVEDNVTLAKEFKEIINASNTIFSVEDVYHNAEEAIERLEIDQPHIILMDIELPGINGVDATKKIKQLRPKTLILVVTVHENSQIVFDALCAGATGYLTKNASSVQLINAINEIADGGSPMSMKIARMVVQSFQRKTSSILSERELEIVTLLSKGSSYQKIADTLFISINTVKYHIKNIYEKLEVTTKQEAIDKANKDRLI
ncbi:MAG: response regulator [bacterium]